jgi:hypothetical protein
MLPYGRLPAVILAVAAILVLVTVALAVFH